MQITYNRGTTFNITHTYKKNGEPSDDGLTLMFTVKEQVDNDADDSTAIIEKNITMDGAVNVITIDPADVPMSVEDGLYVFDLKVIESVGPPAVIYLAGSGDFELDVTATNRIVA